MTEILEQITIVETVECPKFERCNRNARMEFEMKTKFQILDRSEQHFVLHVMDAVLSGALKIPYSPPKYEY